MMTIKEEDNLVLAINNFKYISVNYRLYNVLMKTKYYTPKIYAHKSADDGVEYMIKVSNISEEKMTFPKIIWSPRIKLEEFGKAFKLKGFW